MRTFFLLCALCLCSGSAINLSQVTRDELCIMDSSGWEMVHYDVDPSDYYLKVSATPEILNVLSKVGARLDDGDRSKVCKVLLRFRVLVRHYDNRTVIDSTLFILDVTPFKQNTRPVAQAYLAMMNDEIPENELQLKMYLSMASLADQFVEDWKQAHP